MESDQITRTLENLTKGDRSGIEGLMPLVYKDLRAMAARFLSRESVQHTFQPTDLVNEVFLKLVGQTEVSWAGKTHFFAVSAEAMRRILVDHARTKFRQKRGGRRIRVELREDHALSADSPEEILAINEALEKLSALDATHAKIVECRLFGGMEFRAIAEALAVSTRTIERHWSFISAWLRKELAESTT